MDCPTLEFEYGDADGHAAELSGMSRGVGSEWKRGGEGSVSGLSQSY